MDYSAPLPTHSATFPPIKQLFLDSWNNLINKLLPILIFNSIALGIAVTTILILVALLAGSVGLGSVFSSANPLLSSIPVLIILVVGIITVTAVFSIFHIGNVLILSTTSQQISYKSIVNNSFSMVLMVILGQFLVSLIVIGGLILFIIPGIIFAILLQFAIFSIILDKLSIKEALKRSVYLVSKSFGQIFVRLIIVMLIPILVSMIVGILTAYSLDQGLSGILNLIFSLFYSFFSVSYMITLFKQSKIYAGEGTGNIKFISLIAGLGWILALILSILGFGIISSLVNQPSTSTFPAELNSSLPPELPEGEAIYDDGIFLSTPSAQPSAKLSPKPSVKSATSSSITP